MNTVKLVSKTLFFLTRFLAGAYFLMPLYSALSLVSGWCLNIREGGKYFQVYYPFTTRPFINGDNNISYIIFDFLLPLTLYGLFFLLLSNVFKAFFQVKLFTEYGIKHLTRFYIGNLFVPALTLLLASIFSEVGEPAELLSLLHFILGVFAYFLAAIFRQGVSLQNEKDLFI